MGLTQMVADLEQNLNNAMNQSGLHPTILRLVLESRLAEVRNLEQVALAKERTEEEKANDNEKL